MARIFHLITGPDWESVRGESQWRPPSLGDEGFVHCSKDEEQLMRVVGRLYPDRADMLALELETDQLSYSLIWEPSRSGEIYPHIYGPLELGAVVKTWRVQPDGTGGYALSDH